MTSAAYYMPFSNYTFTCLPSWAVPPLLDTLTINYTCLQNGTWDKPFTSCDAVCPVAPAAPSAGNLTMSGVSSTQLGGRYFNGSTATYACQLGFNISSTVPLVCLDSGQWSASAPTCTQNLCPILYDNKGNVTDSQGNLALSNFTAGSNYTVTCHPNAVTGLGANTTVYSCDLATATWMPTISPCHGHCADFVVPDGYVTAYSNPSLLAGTAAYWACNSGFTASGDIPVLCSDDGQWVYISQPNCTSFIATLQAASNKLPNFTASMVPELAPFLTSVSNNGSSSSSQTIDPTTLTAIGADTLQYILAGLTPEEQQLLGYTLPDLLLACTLPRKICNSSALEFAQFAHLLGDCYTFNHKDASEPFVEQRPGEDQGVFLALNVKQEEYLDFTPSAGMRLIFHDAHDQIIPEVMGDDIAPGYLTQFRVFKTMINRIKTPVSTCANGVSDLAPTTPFYYNGSYSSEACVRSIVQSAIVQVCRCASPMYALPPQGNGVPTCELAQMACVTNFTNNGMLDKVINGVTNDQCPDLCSETIFIVSRTFSVLTTSATLTACVGLEDGYIRLVTLVGGSILHSGGKRQRVMRTVHTVRERRKRHRCLQNHYARFLLISRNNLAVVRGFYAQLYRVTYTEHLAVTIEQLISTFGGLLVIFFGMSVIACVEFLFVLYETAEIIYHKLNRTHRETPLNVNRERKNILMSDIHGLRRVGTTRSPWWLRLFWLLILIVSACGLYVEISTVISDYQQYQTYVDIQLSEGPMTFPSVTFCNLNPYKKSLLKYIQPAQALMNVLRKASTTGL